MELNKVPIGSITIIMLIGVEFILINSHSRNIVLFVIDTHKLKGNIRQNIKVSRRDAFKEDGKRDMVKDKVCIFEITIRYFYKLL